MTYQHAEAFCLMKYASRDGALVEWLWNSRDGVTPFIIRAQDGVTELQHTDFRLDRCVPDYQPSPGERIFIDQTPERLAPRVAAYVERHWDNPQSSLRSQLGTKERAVKELQAAWTRDGAPMIVFARELETTP